MSLSTLFPRPRAVTVRGMVYQVAEFTLGDLADLQDFIDSCCPDPLAVLDRREELSGDPAGWRAALIEAWEAASDGPPDFGTAAADAIVNTVEGVAFFLWVALRRCQPKFTRDDALTLLFEASPAEITAIAAIRRAAIRPDPVRVLERAIDPEFHGASGGPTVAWEKAVAEVAEHYHYTLEYISTLTLTQFAVLRVGGKVESAGREVGEGEDIVASCQRLRERWERFYGRPAADGPPNGDGANGP